MSKAKQIKERKAHLLRSQIPSHLRLKDPLHIIRWLFLAGTPISLSSTQKLRNDAGLLLSLTYLLIVCDTNSFISAKKQFLSFPSISKKWPVETTDLETVASVSKQISFSCTERTNGYEVTSAFVATFFRALSLPLSSYLFSTKQQQINADARHKHPRQSLFLRREKESRRLQRCKSCFLCYFPSASMSWHSPTSLSLFRPSTVMFLAIKPIKPVSSMRFPLPSHL